MRTITSIGLSWLLALPALTGCGSGDASPDITGTLVDVYAPTTGATTRPDLESWTSIAALVENDGAYTTITGTVDPEGNLRIPGVPEGPYWLALTSPPSESLPDAPGVVVFHETSERTLDLGTTYSGRADTVAITQPTFLAIDATLSRPWFDNAGDEMSHTHLADSLQFFSRNASVSGSLLSQPGSAQDGSPPSGSSKVNWIIDVSSIFVDAGGPWLLDGSKGDDFTILHDAQEIIGEDDGVDPWKGYTARTTREALHPQVPTMTNFSTSPIKGAFMAAKPSSFALDYKGSAFNALFPGVPMDYAYVNVSLVLEPGIPHPEVGAFATLLEASTVGQTVFSNPDCGGADCDPTLCPSGCDLGQFIPPGDHAHTFSYVDPFDFGQELVVFHLTLRTDVKALLPEKTSEGLRASFYVQMPAAELDGNPLQLIVGVPQDITVAGKVTPYGEVTSGVGETPVIAWSAPDAGKPTSYQVTVVDLTDVTDKDGLVRLRRSIAFFDVTDTRVALPAGLLKKGTFYYFQVAARQQDSSDRGAPYKVYPIHDATSQTFTGVVTP